MILDVASVRRKAQGLRLKAHGSRRKENLLIISHFSFPHSAFRIPKSEIETLYFLDRILDKE